MAARFDYKEVSRLLSPFHYLPLSANVQTDHGGGVENPEMVKIFLLVILADNFGAFLIFFFLPQTMVPFTVLKKISPRFALCRKWFATVQVCVCGGDSPPSLTGGGVLTHPHTCPHVEP